MRALWSLAIPVLLFTEMAAAQDASMAPPQTIEPQWGPPLVAPSALPQRGSPPPPPSATAAAERERAEVLANAPSKGLGALITGASFVAFGAGDFGAVPVCLNDRYKASFRKTCLEVVVGVGGTFAGTGVILLIVGGSQRVAYNDWKARNEIISHLEVTPIFGGASVGLHASF